MMSRSWLSAVGVALVLQLSGCESAQVEEVDPFQTRSRSRSSAPPPPTASPSTRSGGPLSDVSRDKGTVAGPVGIPGSRSDHSADLFNKKPARGTGSPPLEYDVVGEEIIIDPDSHRGRSKKIRDRPKTPEGTTAEEPEKKS